MDGKHLEVMVTIVSCLGLSDGYSEATGTFFLACTVEEGADIQVVVAFAILAWLEVLIGRGMKHDPAVPDATSLRQRAEELGVLAVQQSVTYGMIFQAFRTIEWSDGR
jgi:hypothetical protein